MAQLVDEGNAPYILIHRLLSANVVSEQLTQGIHSYGFIYQGLDNNSYTTRHGYSFISNLYVKKE
jgi:hypothetical protein